MDIGVTAALTDLAMAPEAFAVAVEERGYHSLYLPEHTHLPVGSVPPSLVDGVHIEDYRRTLDPFAALAAAAALTDRILLGTGIALVAQHDPIVLAKQIATIDRLSGGRFVLGMGYGWNRQEAADHGVEFSDRRAIAREKVLCMQVLWDRDEAAFDGRWVTLSPSYSWPKPVQRPRVRTLVGGAAGPKLFAAVAEYADGWMPIGGSGIAASLPELRRAFEAAGRDPGSLHVVPFGTVPTAGKLEHYASLGVTEVVVRVPSGDDDEMRRVLDDYARFLSPA
ncbi:MAG TPA: TIGR03619 family F420-dependent LLM class oxidoreductase [Acidimicrobiales bacterium]|nr:TIGR03619 family F420-dependent LLM class oxidoreductase [Acidimicrobiales bacterium]